MNEIRTGVSDTVRTTDEGLEGNVGNQLPHRPQTLPRIFVKETHGDVESGCTFIQSVSRARDPPTVITSLTTSPALERVGVGQGVTGLLGDVDDVDGPQPRSKKRLMGVTYNTRKSGSARRRIGVL